jgi:hypothetical protein
MLNAVNSLDDEEPFCNAFDYAVFDGFEGTFDNNFHFAYLIAHTAHHFKFYGAGIKLILSWWQKSYLKNSHPQDASVLASSLSLPSDAGKSSQVSVPFDE